MTKSHIKWVPGLLLCAVFLFSVTAALAAGETSVSYIERSWNGTKVVSETKTITAVPVPEGGGMTSGWYYLDSDVTKNGRIESITGDVHLILGDGFTLDVRGLYVPAGKTLTIYGQSKGTGRIYSHPSGGAGIGGYDGHDNGAIVIHGGVIEATGYDNCAGIGSNSDQSTGNITIYGGTVTADSRNNGAGIGAGRNSEGGHIRIYGGTITATGADSSAGIGGGDASDSYADYTQIEIYGGNITATGDDKGAGIGGGEYGHADITITGGHITATGGDEGGAGIGCGADGNFSTVTITGGTVAASCASGGYGIGNGKNGTGSTVNLGYTDAASGMSVTAVSYAGTVILQKDFINEFTSEVIQAGIYNEVPADMCLNVPLAPATTVTCLGLDNVERMQTCIPVRPGLRWWVSDWYAVTTDVTIDGEILVGRDVNLILTNGCTMNVWNIKVSDGSSITIWGQTGNSGTLHAKVERYNVDKAAIGGSSSDCGTITINGGTVIAEGGDNGVQGSAGIGGCKSYKAGTVIINGGNVTAIGGEGAAGIGGGVAWDDEACARMSGSGRVEINGGSVHAESKHGGAGIGSGAYYNPTHSTYAGLQSIIIRGGTVNASGSDFVEWNGSPGYTEMGGVVGSGAGIGGGSWSSAGSITITGGSVTANGTGSAPAIGTGGTKYADQKCAGGSITITGGTVMANDVFNGCGIGGGRNGGGVTINISGGQVRTSEVGNVGIGSLDGGLPCTTTLSWTEGSYETMSVWTYNWNGNVTLEKSFADESRYYEAGTVVDGQVFNRKTVVPLVIAYGTPDFVIPSGVTVIENNAFEGVAAAIVEIPSGCVSIGSRAFRNCGQLTQVRVPAGCAIGENAFDGCEKVYLFGDAGSSAESFCLTHENCVFVAIGEN